VANFAEELKKAADGLSKFNAELSKRASSQPRDELGRFVSAGGGGAAGGLGGLAGIVGGVAGGKGFLAAAGPLGAAIAAGGMVADAVNAGAKFFTPAASAYAVTGSAQGFASAVTQSTLSAVGGTSLGGLLLGATGVSAAQDTNQRAGAAVGNVTEDLARIGVGVSGAQRQRLFDIAQEQEKRVTEERARIAEIAGSAAELSDAKPAGAGAGFDAVVSALNSIESLLRGLVGGSR